LRHFGLELFLTSFESAIEETIERQRKLKLAPS
jgi:hypothetical protein